MKIISGIYKGRNILGYDIEGTRPTMERVKESIFGMIQEDLKESIVLDLFSGSGNLGIESLSEGASFAYLCDKNQKAIDTMMKNIKALEIKNVEIYPSDYKKCLEDLHKKNKKINIIFLDPPYNSNLLENSIEQITKYDLLEENGLIVCENNSLDRIIYPTSYTVYKERKYGDKYVVILKKI